MTQGREQTENIAKFLPGLPPYGPLPTTFPHEWGRIGREGIVVEFSSGSDTWVANFRPGLGGLQFVGIHQDNLYAIVIAAGDLWIVDLHTRTANQIVPAVDAMWHVQNPNGWVFSRQGLALARLGPGGLVWHTRRLSWDGFDQVQINQNELTGMAWSPLEDTWRSFCVDLASGKSRGGSYFPEDRECWERLAG